MREAGFDIDTSALKLEHMYEQMSIGGGHGNLASTHGGLFYNGKVWISAMLPEWEACA